jgi:mono/diheme cytochrome c family protein
MKRISKTMYKTQLIKTWIAAAVVIACLAGCTAHGDYPGREYAPNMYHSVGYEPLTQITDETAGAWVEALDERKGEYFNSNKYNPFRMNMRVPPANTVMRNKFGWLPYRGSADTVSLRMADKLVNPLDSNKAVVDAGKALFEIYCDHCHGANGTANGKVADKYNGVANLTLPNLQNITEGHIFHVITYGKGLMGAHGSQVSPEDRWKIAKYVKVLQKKK